MTQPIIYVKNINRAGTSVYNSKYGEVELEVRVIRGSKVHEIFVEGVSKHVTRVFAEDAWLWLGEYLGCVIHELPPVKKRVVKGNKL